MSLVFKNLCDTILDVLSLIAIREVVMTLYLMLNEKCPHPPTARPPQHLIWRFREFEIRAYATLRIFSPELVAGPFPARPLKLNSPHSTKGNVLYSFGDHYRQNQIHDSRGRSSHNGRVLPIKVCTFFKSS